jgi:Flp pilus assembly pilin Flp
MAIEIEQRIAPNSATWPPALGNSNAKRRRGISRGTQKQEAIKMKNPLERLWSNQEGQDIAEYAVMLAVILVLIVGTIRLVGSNANNVFSSVASSVH